MTDQLRQAFLRRLTVDSPHRDRRRRNYNQAIFDPSEGFAIWTSTDLAMVMDAFDAAVKDVAALATGDCPHLSYTGIDTYFGPGKIMRCDMCGHEKTVDWRTPDA